MSIESPTTPTALGQITQGPSAFEIFLNKNFKFIAAVLAFIAIIAIAYVIFSGIKSHKESTAGQSLTQATTQAQLESVVKNHPGTKASVTAQLLIINELWANKKNEEAISQLKNFIAKNATYSEISHAKASLATKLASLGKTPEANQLFQEIANDKDNHLAPYALFSLANLAQKENQLSKASDFYNQLKTQFPKSPFTQQSAKLLASLHAKSPTAIDPPPVNTTNEAKGDSALPVPTLQAPASPTK